MTKVLANTVAISTSNNTIGAARLVRVINSDTTFALITIFDTVANTQIGTIQMVPNEVLMITKKGTDALKSNNNTLTLATKVGSTF